MDSPNETSPPSDGRTLGTFAGVFTPSILTILGLILFLRMGYVVGAAGLWSALLIIGLANLISILTSVSLATIATNLRVKGGGDYYLISRTLGVEYGGALGLVLFIAQSVSIAFYTIGFGEAVAQMSGLSGDHSAQLVSAGAVAVLFVLAWFGADVATRAQFVVMAVLLAALASFVLGAAASANGSVLRENWRVPGEIGFWALFAVFFPAVTGFTQGVSMSGNLKDPSRSLPIGTFAAVGLSFAVYLGVALLLAGALPARELATDYGAMRRISASAWLIDAGIVAATLSSALASFLGAPRILQTLASDRVFPLLNPFAKGHGPSGNPRRGVLLAAAIAAGTLALGQLNLVARIVAMFFLVSYGLLNYATYFEARSKSPSFRPTFKWFHPTVSLLGFITCVAVMLAIDPVAGIVAGAVLFGIHNYIKRTATTARWADSSRSYGFQRVREHLIDMEGTLEHPRDWRPVILAVSDDPDRRARLLRFAQWIEGGSGLTTAVRVIEAEGVRARRLRVSAEEELRAEIAHRKFKAFPLILTTPDPVSCIPVLFQSLGMGPIRANVVLLSWFDHPPAARDAPGLELFSQYLYETRRQGLNVVILTASTQGFATTDKQPPETRRIDVWKTDGEEVSLSMLLAHLMTRTSEWEDATIRLLSPVGDGRTIEEEEERMFHELREMRISAEAVAVADPNLDDVLVRSADAAAVFLPLRVVGETPLGPFETAPNLFLEKLQITALVLPAGNLEINADPEAGLHAEIAEATDEFKRLKRLAEQAERKAEQARAVAEELARRFNEKESVEDGPAAGAAEVEEAEARAEKLKRRAAKARVKADAALERARALGIIEDDADTETG